jgi:hypothetical protein
MPALKSSPNVPGYAIAYTPKDGPSTPAVVIAPEAQSDPENKRPMSHTMPSRARVATVGATPLAQPSVAIDDDFNPYAPKKGKAKLIGALFAGVAAIVLGAFAVRGMSGGSPTPATVAPTEAPAAAAQVVPAAAAARAEAAPAEAAPAEAAPAAKPTAAATEAANTPIATADKPRAPAKREPAPKPAAAARPKAAPVAATPPRTVSRPPAAPSETNSAPAKPASKGVIVRDAPF